MGVPFDQIQRPSDGSAKPIQNRSTPVGDMMALRRALGTDEFFMSAKCAPIFWHDASASCQSCGSSNTQKVCPSKSSCLSGGHENGGNSMAVCSGTSNGARFADVVGAADADAAAGAELLGRTKRASSATVTT